MRQRTRQSQRTKRTRKSWSPFLIRLSWQSSTRSIRSSTPGLSGARVLPVFFFFFFFFLVCFGVAFFSCSHCGCRYDQRGGGKSAPPGSQGRRGKLIFSSLSLSLSLFLPILKKKKKKKGKGEKKQFENNLRFVGDFATVEDFWSYFNNMRKPSGLESNS